MEQETGQPVVTAKDAQDLQQLVTGAVESAAELAEGTDDVEEKGDEAVNRREWKELFESRILQRGSAYYKEGAVETLWREGGVVKAVVLGSKRYRVEIDLEDGQIEGWSCNCPYASDGTPCKHLAAVFYALNDDDDGRKEIVSHTEQRPIRELIQELNLEQAHALLLRLAEQNRETAGQIWMAAEPPSQQQIQYWEKRIDRLLERAAGRYGYIEYDWAWDTMCQLDDFLSDTAEHLRAVGYIWEAFQLTGYGFQAAAQCDMDDSDGGLTMLAETCHDLWSGQINAATPELRRRMYQWFQHTWHTSDGLCQELLWEAQQELFHDPEFLQSNIDQLDRMIQDEQVRQDQRYSRLPQLVLQKLERMEELGLPQKKVQQVEREHWALPDIRRRVISRLLKEKRYTEAESLLRQSKKLDREWPSLVSRHSQELIGLYEKTGQAEKLLEELQFQVLQCGQRDLTYVKKFKEKFPPDQWTGLRERLLAEKTLYGNLREELLEMEGLYGRLMDRVAALKSLQALDRWENVLRPRVPERMRDAYIRCLEIQMRLASDRKQYAAAIAYLKKLRIYPGSKDSELARRWRRAYPRRRSMLDELRKAGY